MSLTRVKRFRGVAIVLVDVIQFTARDAIIKIRLNLIL